jgi:hypothetical protein
MRLSKKRLKQIGEDALGKEVFDRFLASRSLIFCDECHCVHDKDFMLNNEVAPWG